MIFRRVEENASKSSRGVSIEWLRSVPYKWTVNKMRIKHWVLLPNSWLNKIWNKKMMGNMPGKKKWCGRTSSYQFTRTDYKIFKIFESWLLKQLLKLKLHDLTIKAMILKPQIVNTQNPSFPNGCTTFVIHALEVISTYCTHMVETSHIGNHCTSLSKSAFSNITLVASN